MFAGILVLQLIILIFTGCTNNKIDSEYREFKESYMSATGFVDFTGKNTSSLEALKKMDVNIVKEEMKKMRLIMNEMQKQANSKHEKDLCKTTEQLYQDVEIMLDDYGNLDKLSLDDKLNLDAHFVLAKVSRDDIKKGDL